MFALADRDNTRSFDLEIWIKINRENVSHHENSSSLARERRENTRINSKKKKQSQFVKARNWKPHVFFVLSVWKRENKYHSLVSGSGVMLLPPLLLLLVLLFFSFHKYCSQFATAHFLVLAVGTFVQTFCSNLIRLIVCVSLWDSITLSLLLWMWMWMCSFGFSRTIRLWQIQFCVTVVLSVCARVCSTSWLYFPLGL